jgi:DNA-binding GntR family transcriptional regulator
LDAIVKRLNFVEGSQVATIEYRNDEDSIREDGGSDVPSVTDVVHRRLRRAIMSGAIRPGERLRQEDVAERLRISRSPAREALARLAMEGLVEQRPRRGYVVASLDPAEIEEIFGIRMLLEERAGVLATQRRTDKDISEVERAFRALDDIEVNSTEDIDRFAAANRAFHERLFQSSRSKHLCRMMLQLRDQLERYVRFEMSMHDRIPPGDHSRIFEAFKKGDAELVGRLSREHCEKVSSRLLERLRAREQERQASSGRAARAESDDAHAANRSSADW